MATNIYEQLLQESSNDSQNAVAPDNEAYIGPSGEKLNVAPNTNEANTYGALPPTVANKSNVYLDLLKQEQQQAQPKNIYQQMMDEESGAIPAKPQSVNQPEIQPSDKRQVGFLEATKRGLIGGLAKTNELMAQGLGVFPYLEDKTLQAFGVDSDIYNRYIKAVHSTGLGQPGVEAEAIKPTEELTTGGKIGQPVGEMVSQLPYMMMTGSIGAEQAAAQDAFQVVKPLMPHIKQSIQAMLPMATQAGAETVQQSAEQGDNPITQTAKGIASATATAVTGAIPLAMRSKIANPLARFLEQGAYGFVTGLPINEQQKVTDSWINGKPYIPSEFKDMAIQAIPMALMTGTFGAIHAPDKAPRLDPSANPVVNEKQNAISDNADKQFSSVDQEKSNQQFQVLTGQLKEVSDKLQELPEDHLEIEGLQKRAGTIAAQMAALRRGEPIELEIPKPEEPQGDERFAPPKQEPSVAEEVQPPVSAAGETPAVEPTAEAPVAEAQPEKPNAVQITSPEETLLRTQGERPSTGVELPRVGEEVPKESAPQGEAPKEEVKPEPKPTDTIPEGKEPKVDESGMPSKEQQAANIRARKKKQGGYADASILQDLYKYGARVYEKGMQYAEWLGGMIKEFGKGFKEVASKVWNHIKENWNKDIGGGFDTGGRSLEKAAQESKAKERTTQEISKDIEETKARIAEFEKKISGLEKERFVPQEEKVQVNRGKETLLKRISAEEAFGKFSTDEAGAMRNFVNMLHDDYLSDVALSIRKKSNKNALGFYNFADGIVTLVSNAIKRGSGGFDKTFFHEIWHSLSRFLPPEDLEKVRKQYLKEQAKYVEKNPWFKALIGRDKLTEDQYNDWRKFVNQKTADKHTNLIVDREGKPVLDKGKKQYSINYNKENYRFQNIDEWWAEKMADKSMDDYYGMEEPVRNALGYAKKLYNSILETIKNVFSPDIANSIYNKFTSGEAGKKQRVSPLGENGSEGEMVKFSKEERPNEINPNRNLELQANEARDRIDARRREGRQNMGVDPENLADYAIIAAHHISRGIKTFTEFSKNMLEEFGNRIRPYLNKIWEAGKKAERAFSTGGGTFTEKGSVAGAIRLPRSLGKKVEKAKEAAVFAYKSKPAKEAITVSRDAGETSAGIIATHAKNEINNQINRDFIGNKNRKNARVALPFVVEAKGDINELNRMEQVLKNSTKADPDWKKKALDAIDFAKTNLTKLIPTADRASKIFIQQAGEENANGINTPIMEAYFPHYQDLDNQMMFGKPGVSGGTGFRKMRVHDTFADSIAAGVDPKSLDGIDILQKRIDSGQKAIAYRTWIDSLKTTTDPNSGKPVVTKIPLAVRPDGSSYPQPPDGYHTEHLAGQNVAVKDGYEGFLSALDDPSWFSKTIGGRLATKAAGLGKGITLPLDTFHLGRVAINQAVLKAAGLSTMQAPIPSYRKGATLLDHSIPEIQRMIANGEIPKKWATGLLENKRVLDLMVSQGFNVGRIADALHQDWVHNIPGIGDFNKWLFGQFQRGAMAEVGLLEFQRYSKAYKGLPEKEIARKVAKDLNTKFGSLGRQGIMKGKTIQDLSRLVFLAPQWSEGLIRSELGALKQTGQAIADAATGKRLFAGVLARYTGGMIAAQFLANQIINYATRGTPTWDNPEEGIGAKMSAWIPDIISGGPGFFLNPLSLAAETTHVLMKGFERTGNYSDTLSSYLRSKGSTLAHPVADFVTGKTFLGKQIKPDQMLNQMIKDAVPQPIIAGTLYAAGKQAVTGEPSEQFAGQYQKQIISSFGIKPETAPSDESRIYTIARHYKAENNIEDRQTATEFPYHDLNHALNIGNKPEAKAAMEVLLKTKTGEQIAKYYSKSYSTMNMFQSKAQQKEFVDSLNDEQRDAYERAREKRKDISISARDILQEMK